MGDEKRQRAACAPMWSGIGRGGSACDVEEADLPGVHRRASSSSRSTSCTTMASLMRGDSEGTVHGCELARVDGPGRRTQSGGLAVHAAHEAHAFVSRPPG